MEFVGFNEFSNFCFFRITHPEFSSKEINVLTDFLSSRGLAYVFKEDDPKLHFHCGILLNKDVKRDTFQKSLRRKLDLHGNEQLAFNKKCLTEDRTKYIITQFKEKFKITQSQYKYLYDSKNRDCIYKTNTLHKGLNPKDWRYYELWSEFNKQKPKKQLSTKDYTTYLVEEYGKQGMATNYNYKLTTSKEGLFTDEMMDRKDQLSIYVRRWIWKQMNLENNKHKKIKLISFNFIQNIMLTIINYYHPECPFWELVRLDSGI